MAIGAVAVIALIIGIVASTQHGGGSVGSQTEPTVPVILPATDVPREVPSTAFPTSAGSSCPASVLGSRVDVGLIDPVVVVIPSGWEQEGTSFDFTYGTEWRAGIDAQPGVYPDTPAVDYLTQLGYPARVIDPPAGSRIVSEGYDDQSWTFLAVRDDGEKLIISAIPVTGDPSLADPQPVHQLISAVALSFGCPEA